MKISAPRHALSPTAPAKPFAPAPAHFVTESRQRLRVAGDSVVGIVSAQFVAQRRVLLGQAPVSMYPTPLAHRSQRPAEPVLRRLALDHPAPLPGASPIVGEPQHHEAALALRTAPLRLRRSAKLYHPRLLGVQPQPVLLQPLRQHPKHPSHVVLVLEHQHRVVGVADLKRPPPKPRLHFVLEPLIQHFVQVDVRQCRRDDAPNAKGNFRFERQIVGWRDRPLVDMRRKR